MLPIQAIDATSCNFVHRRIIGGIADIVLGPGGGGGGGVSTIQPFVPCSPTRKFRVANPRCPGGWADRGGTCNPQNAGCPRPDMGGGRGFAPGLPPNGMSCGPGFLKMPNGDCVALPPTTGITTPAEGQFQAVPGAFGMPAMAPKHELRSRFICPTGMVLGTDDLCYPKQVLRRDSKWRKWRPGMRPVLTGGERRGIARARRSVERAKEATASLGVTVRKKKC